jgi:prepilin-type N-terminal cleavage/methylation domain-containing protein
MVTIMTAQDPVTIASANPANRRPRRGLTLVELLISMTIMTMIAGAVGMLAHTVQISSDYADGHSMGTQHARVSLERITRAANKAHANDNFPGAAVFATTVSGWRFPDTLVVWKPASQPVNPDGLPLFSELVVFCPDATLPNRLVEITNASDTRQVPALSDAATWASELATLKASTTARKLLLTDLMRTAVLTAGSPNPRGCVRFEVEFRPTAAEWASYKSGATAWNELSFVQDIYGSQTGLARAWIRIELQVVPGANAAGVTAQEVLPFLDSAAVYFELHK